MQDTSLKPLSKERPVLRRLQKKLQVNIFQTSMQSPNSPKARLGTSILSHYNTTDCSVQACRDADMSKMMTVEQAEEENAKLPEGYRYVLADILDSDGRSHTA